MAGICVSDVVVWFLTVLFCGFGVCCGLFFCGSFTFCAASRCSVVVVFVFFSLLFI